MPRVAKLTRCTFLRPRRGVLLWNRGTWLELAISWYRNVEFKLLPVGFPFGGSEELCQLSFFSTLLPNQSDEKITLLPRIKHSPMLSSFGVCVCVRNIILSYDALLLKLSGLSLIISRNSIEALECK